MNWYYITSRSGKVVGMIKCKNHKRASEIIKLENHYLVRCYSPNWLFTIYYYLTRGTFHIKIIEKPELIKK